MFTFSSAIAPNDAFYFTDAEDGNAWILRLKPSVRLVPQPVYSGSKGFIFYFKDDMTPRPFDESWGGWKVSFLNPNITSHRLLMASPTHTYFCLHVSDDCDEIVTEEEYGRALAMLSWKK